MGTRDTVVITGRTRPMLLDREGEKQLGESSVASLPMHKALPASDKRTQAVQAVAQRIADAVEELFDELDAEAARGAAAALAGNRSAEEAAARQAERPGEELDASLHHPSRHLTVATPATASRVSFGAAGGGQDSGVHAGASTQPSADAEDLSRPARRPQGWLRRVYSMLGWERPSRWQWRIVVIDDDSVVNALCAPGGTVVVFTGFLKFVDAAVKAGAIPDRESALATCMSHEIAHAIARHGAERAASAPLMFWLRWLQDSSPLLPVLFDFLYEKPYSRLLEAEADEIGLHLLARACYDTSKAAHFYAAMGSNSSGWAAYLHTHPADEARAEAAAALSAVLALRQRAYCVEGLRGRDRGVERKLTL
jgi:predicted Zn-dependent protease